MSLTTVLLVLALIAFVLATFNVSLGSLNLIAAGLALWVLALLLGDVAGISATTLLIIVVVVVLVVVVVYLIRRQPAAPAK